MSLNDKRLYGFGDFVFSAGENVLRRNGKPLPMTPKMSEVLKMLIENHGRIVEKNELMKKVWADAFVEENNLTFTVRRLRQILEDDAHQPVFIETIARRGYRFIHEVEETSAAETNPQFKKQIFFAACLFIGGIIFIGALFIRSRNNAPNAPILTALFASEKLSTNGKVMHAVISPDGKNVIYTNEIEGKISIWLRQIESSNNVELIPSTNEIYGGLAFSPDGNFLYFTRSPRNSDRQLDIYRVSIFGGIPIQITNETQGWVSISPDGSKISFVRCHYRDDEYCSLWIADSTDGRNEQKIASRPRPVRIGDHKFSPDGKSVAFAVGQSENQANEFALMEVDLESGQERELTAEKFFHVKSLVWLPDKNGILFTASKIPNKEFRIWQVSGGEVAQLTKDSENYAALSLDKTASRLVSTQIKQDFRLQLLEAKNPSARHVLADATTVSFAPNGRIFFSSLMSGNDEIWSVSPDGSKQRQLTNNAADESLPVASADSGSIFFASNRTGAVHVWRMNADGSNQTQITKQTGGFPIFATSDGRWIYYQSGLDRTLWRKALGNGEEQLVLKKEKYRFAVSPDGLRVAYSEMEGDGQILTIASLADAQVIKTFQTADKTSRIFDIVWSPDEKSLIYILNNRQTKNNTLWRQSLDTNMPQQIADLGDEAIYQLALAHDGKTFAVVQGGWRHDAVLLNGLK